MLRKQDKTKKGSKNKKLTLNKCELQVLHITESEITDNLLIVNT